jgi:hypothetical protein
MSQSARGQVARSLDADQIRSRMAFFTVTGLCIFQMLLMLSLTYFFLSFGRAAAELHGRLNWLGDYSPLLMKYVRATAGAKAPFDLPVVFSIYFSFLVVQAIVLAAILIMIFKSLPSRVKFHFSGENIVIVLIALGALTMPLWDILIGPSDIRNPDVFSDRIFDGSVATAFVQYCVVMPCFDFVFFVCVFVVPRNRP